MSLKKRLRLEALDERTVPDGSPGTPPESPPPQTGDPAAQATQQVWVWIAWADGGIELDQALAPVTSPTDLSTYIRSTLDISTGTIISADANFTGQDTLIQPPANPQANTVYLYNQADSSWSSVPVSADGTLLAPTAGNSVIPITPTDGQGVAWTVQPQNMYLPAAALAINAQAPANSQQGGNLPVLPQPLTPLPPHGLDPTKQSTFYPGPAVFTFPNPAGPPTVYTFPGGVYVQPGPNGSIQFFPAGGQPGSVTGPNIPAPGAQIPVTGPNSPPQQVTPPSGSTYQYPGIGPSPLPPPPRPEEPSTPPARPPIRIAPYPYPYPSSGGGSPLFPYIPNVPGIRPRYEPSPGPYIPIIQGGQLIYPWSQYGAGN